MSIVKMNYPIFIYCKDDRSIRIHFDKESFNHYEQIDVESGLYSGWDVNGYPLKVLWIRNIGIKIEQISDQSQLDNMRETIFRYVESATAYYRPDKPFVYEKTSNDFIGILKEMKQHIQNAPFKQKIINFFRRF